MTKKNRVIIGISSAIIILLLIAGFSYRTFFRAQYGSSTNIIGIMVLSIVIGAVITYLIFQLRQAKKSSVSTKTSSHTVVESIKRVFKIVVTEGQMNEIFNYENTKKLLKFIPSTKKALVIVRAKVMIGYDVNKCKWEIDEEKRVINLLSFPKPEILSLETDFNYYYFEDDLFNFISRKDLQDIQFLAKEQVKKSVLQSDLLKIASEQMKFLLGETTGLNNWRIENIALIDDFSYPQEEEEKIDESENTTHLLKKINLLDKAANLLKIKL